MMKLLTALVFGLAALPASAQTARFDWFDYKGRNPVDATLQPGPDEYRNPILAGFYPDPSVTRAGDDFYLVTSTFDYFPGIPVFHSRDLVNWTQIGNAIDRPGQLDFKNTTLSRGVFAPSIQAKDGIFYILNTCVDCGGNFILTAKNPAGPWSDPVWLPELEGGIDPSLFFDDDGRTWVVNNGPPEGEPQYQGHRAIWVQELDLATLKTKGPRKVLVNGGVDFSKKPVWIEGPHILKKDGWYYLICAEGGTEVRHSQVALRSRSIWGPFEPGPTNPILTQRDLPEDRAFPITSAGHAQLVETQKGEWWATFLATRPYTGDHYNTGRETFLLPVTWQDGWLRITRPGEAIPYVHKRPTLPTGAKPPVPTAGPFEIRDEFDGEKLPLYWMMMRQPKSDWHALDHGQLLLAARPEGLDARGNPSFLARRQQHTEATAETVVRFKPGANGDRAGLVALQGDDHWIFVGVGRVEGRRAIVEERKLGDRDQSGHIFIDGKEGDPVHLQIVADGTSYRLFYALEPGKWKLVSSVASTSLSTRTAGGFVGAVFGLLAQSGSEPVSPIRLNQLGFEPDGVKRAMLASAAKGALDWQLLDARGGVALRGRTSVFGTDAASGETVHAIDFSDFHQAGKAYRLKVGEMQSRAFDIAPGGRGRLAQDALHFFYHHRAGMPIEARFVGAEWARPAGHPKEIVSCVSGKDARGTVWPECPYRRDVTGGWYDAGDQGKYVVNGGITLWTLLNAYERAKLHGAEGGFADGKGRIPESGNRVNDLLDEARYEMEFLLKMQVPQGTHLALPVGVPPPFVPPAPGSLPVLPPLERGPADLDAGGMAHHKVADRNWTALPTPPHLDREERILFPPTTGATLNLAATAAQCARLWRGVDDRFAARCRKAAEDAWAAARRNPEVFAIAAFGGSGGYGDRDLSDEFYWAAAELYATTGKPEYLDFVHASPHWSAPLSEPGWPKTAPLGTISLALMRAGLSGTDRGHVRAMLVQAADRFVADGARTGYHVPYDPGGYPWGSTSNLLNRAILLAYATDFTGETKYRDAVTDAMDYLLGRNPIDRSYVSGYGARPMRNPHHRFWAPSLDPRLPGPPPGVLSGGPNSTSMSDPVASTIRGKCAPLACYADDVRAFALNEIAINWNAPLLWVAWWMDQPK